MSAGRPACPCLVKKGRTSHPPLNHPEYLMRVWYHPIPEWYRVAEEKEEDAEEENRVMSSPFHSSPHQESFFLLLLLLLLAAARLLDIIVETRPSPLRMRRRRE